MISKGRDVGEFLSNERDLLSLVCVSAANGDGFSVPHLEDMSDGEAVNAAHA